MNSIRRIPLLVALALLPLAACDDEEAKVEKTVEASPSTEFMRFERHADGSGALSVALVRYGDEEGRVVDFIGAVHIGDAAYYELLNRIFRSYDSLLYEMVKAKKADVSRIGKGKDSSLISQFQRALKDTLGLEFQLDAIDYGAKNFVHADLDMETFSALSKERGESLISLMLNAALEAARKEAANPDAAKDALEVQAQLIGALFSRDQSRALKLVLGEQLGELERISSGLERGPRGEESVLLVERNKAALAVLREQLDAGKERLGIFYGAAHFPDMEKRLLAEFGMTKKSTQWLLAWDIPKAVRSE
jgi:hypothetical protein